MLSKLYIPTLLSCVLKKISEGNNSFQEKINPGLYITPKATINYIGIYI